MPQTQDDHLIEDTNLRTYVFFLSVHLTLFTSEHVLLCVCVLWRGVIQSDIKMLIKAFVVFGPLILRKMSAAHWCETTLNADG